MAHTGIITPDTPGGETRSHSTQVAAPGPYVRNGDFLRLNASSTDASATLQLNGRILRPDGEIVPFNVSMPITGTGNQVPVTVPLVEGWIIGFIVFVSAGTITDGEIVASVEVVQGAGAGLTRVMCLGSGEVTNMRSLGLGAYFYASPATTATAPTVVTNALANPGAGNEGVWTVPAGQVWEIQSIIGFFSASIAVATRETSITFDDGTNIFQRAVSNSPINAGTAVTFIFSQFPGFFSSGTSVMYQTPMPRQFLGPGYRVSTKVQNLQAADTWTGLVLSYRQY